MDKEKILINFDQIFVLVKDYEKEAVSSPNLENTKVTFCELYFFLVKPVFWWISKKHYCGNLIIQNPLLCKFYACKSNLSNNKMVM